MKKRMGTTALILGILLVNLALFSPSHAFLKGDINSDERIDMVEAMSALQVASGLRSAAAPKDIDVPADFPTIQAAINAASPGDKIHVAAGTYTESLRLYGKLGIELLGAGKDVTTIQGQTTEPKIKLMNSLGIKIDGFLIRDGAEGIKTNFSSVYVYNCRLENNQSYGIRVFFNSYGDLQNVSAKSNGTGIRYNSGSSGWMYNCEASNNQTGIAVDRNASVFAQNITSTNNTGHGISSDNGDIWITGPVNVSANGGNGLNISSGSNFGMEGEINISGNGGNGIGVYSNSSFGVSTSQTTLTISGNGGNGIQVGEMAKLSINNISSCSISQNAKGIDIFKNATAWIAAPCTISDNNSTGINVYANSILSLFGPQTEIYGNGEDGIALYQNSILERASTSPLTITTNSGIGIRCGNPFPTFFDTTNINFGSPSPADPKYGLNTQGNMTGCGQ